MAIHGVNPRFIGPEVPGYVFAGNASDAKDEADAIAKYARHYALPESEVIALRTDYEGWSTWATYVKAEHARIVETTSRELALLVQMLGFLQGGGF